MQVVVPVIPVDPAVLVFFPVAAVAGCACRFGVEWLFWWLGVEQDKICSAGGRASPPLQLQCAEAVVPDMGIRCK